STKKTVTEISDYLSFATSSQFCRFFKRMTALSPKEYRASI
ncbi:MAG: helix-turn-helix domain-containing protein, partial [Bacteroidales bacterium]|nr:helix-turn-helix domain-containing protein [Bacteroidales bacterium]